MFIGRERELASLNKHYETNHFELVVLYGRRRIGKTALIKQFIAGKKAIYFTGVESSARQNLENLSRCILSFQTGTDTKSSFSSFQEALEHAFKLAEKERIILVIDEYPHAARSSKSLASTIQLLIDKYKDTSKLMLILCGSSVPYMEDQVFAYKAPLYGRRTAQIELLPFSFADSCRWLEGFSAEEKALAYGIAGGTPQYLLQLDNQHSIESNIKRLFLSPDSVLYEEPANLLRQEIREPALYTALLSAIAGGASRLSEIAGKVQEDTNFCSFYMKNLITLGFVQKEAPYGENASRKTLYSITDNMFRFWYRFVPENASLISLGAADAVYRQIEPQLSDYMGKVFEEICRQHLYKLLLAGKCPVEFSSLGRWWGSDPIRKSQAEIDIMGEQDKDTALFGACRWKNEPVDLPVLEALIQRSKLFPYCKNHFFVFSKSGFTKDCTDRAKQLGNVALVSYEDILGS